MNNLVMDKSFNCKDIVVEFLKSFGDDTDACAVECMKREQELVDQFQEYAKCIRYLMSDKRYVPIVAMRNIGSVCCLGFPDEDNALGTVMMVAGRKEGVEKCLEHLKEKIKE